MKTVKLAKNETSLKLLDDWHRRFEQAIGFEYETRKVETSFGFSDVIITGDRLGAGSPSEPPIVILHGAMAGAPFALGEICDLPAKRNMYAVNIPGQSTRAAQGR